MRPELLSSQQVATSPATPHRNDFEDSREVQPRPGPCYMGFEEREA